MSPLTRQTKIILVVDFFILIICFQGLYQFHLRAGFNPDSHLSFISSEGKIFVDEVEDARLQDKIFSGDEFKNIETYPISSKEEIEFILDGFNISDTIKIGFIRNGKKIEQTTIIPSFYTLNYLIIQLLAGCFFFIVGIFVFVKRSALNDAKVFHWLSIGIAIIIMTTWGKYNINPQGLGQSIRLIFSSAYAVIPTLSIHLSLVFPKPKWININKLIIPLYSLSILLGLWMGISFLFATMPVSLDWFNVFYTVFNLTRLYFAVGIIIGLAILTHSYFIASEGVERRKLRWVLLGLAVGATAFVCFWQLPQVFGYYGIISEEYIVSIVTIIPLTFAIAIIRYNLFDIDLIFNRSTVYIMVIGILVIIYAGVVYLLVSIVGAFMLHPPITVTVIAALFIALLSEPIRRSVQRFVDKKFFHVLYNYRLVQRNITEKLYHCLDQKSLADYVIKQVDDLFQLNCLCFYSYNEKIKNWKLLAQHNCPKQPINRVRNLVNIIEGSEQKIISFQEHLEPGISFNAVNKKAFNTDIVLVIPMKTQEGRICSLLMLGCKKSDLRFNVEDIDLLKTISEEVEATMDRIKLQQDTIIQQEETQRLKEINQLKSFFVSSVSHEMQTPLTSIKMFTELLQDEQDLSKDVKKEYIKIIEGESERLNRLIRNVLDFSKIERRTKTYQFKKVNLIEIVESVLQVMQYPLKQHGFQIEVNLPDQTSFINADEDAVIQAITNLISNSIKYSLDEKSISISLIMDKEEVLLSVSDKGVGISADDQNQIFEAFYRSGNDRTKSLGGAGLGLNIVQDIMEAHKGRIELESTPGKGSTFKLIFQGGKNA